MQSYQDVLYPKRLLFSDISSSNLLPAIIDAYFAVPSFKNGVLDRLGLNLQKEFNFFGKIHQQFLESGISSHEPTCYLYLRNHLDYLATDFLLFLQNLQASCLIAPKSKLTSILKKLHAYMYDRVTPFNTKNLFHSAYYAEFIKTDECEKSLISSNSGFDFFLILKFDCSPFEFLNNYVDWILQNQTMPIIEIQTRFYKKLADNKEYDSGLIKRDFTAHQFKSNLFANKKLGDVVVEAWQPSYKK